MKLLLLANGDFENTNVNINDYNLICCIDGGFNNYIKYFKKDPDFIIGDLDSISPTILSKYQNKINIIKKDNQDVSDLLFAVNYFINNFKDIQEIDIYGAIGNRIDHTLCNIILLKHIPNNIKAKIISLQEEIYLVRKNITIQKQLNKTISLIPLTNITNINTKGLKWELIKEDLNYGFINGISNIALQNDIEINIDNGELLVISNKFINL